MKFLLFSLFLSGWGNHCEDFFTWKTDNVFEIKKVAHLEAFKLSLDQISISHKACEMELEKKNIPLSCHKLYFLSKKYLCKKVKRPFYHFLKKTCKSSFFPKELTQIKSLINNLFLIKECREKIRKYKDLIQYQSKDRELILLLKSQLF